MAHELIAMASIAIQEHMQETRIREEIQKEFQDFREINRMEGERRVRIASAIETDLVETWTKRTKGVQREQLYKIKTYKNFEEKEKLWWPVDLYSELK